MLPANQEILSIFFERVNEEIRSGYGQDVVAFFFDDDEPRFYDGLTPRKEARLRAKLDPACVVATDISALNVALPHSGHTVSVWVEFKGESPTVYHAFILPGDTESGLALGDWYVKQPPLDADTIRRVVRGI